jgi:hypothetical protein
MESCPKKDSGCICQNLSAGSLSNYISRILFELDCVIESSRKNQLKFFSFVIQGVVLKMYRL